MSTIYTKTFTVGSTDMDVNYHLTKIAAAKFFQETFALMCTHHNVAAFDIREQGLAWVIAELHIEFPGSMPYWGEEFSVSIWVSEKTRIRTSCDFEITCGNRLIARGNSAWFLLNMASRRPARAQEVTAAFPLLPERVFGDAAPLPIDFEGNHVASKLHHVTVRDLDFNHHVNNCAYIGISIETVPADFLQQFNVCAYRVKFLQESHLNDELRCDIFRDGYRMKARITRSSDGAEVCHMVCQCNDRTDFSNNPREGSSVF